MSCWARVGVMRSVSVAPAMGTLQQPSLISQVPPTLQQSVVLRHLILWFLLSRATLLEPRVPVVANVRQTADVLFYLHHRDTGL